MSVVTTGAEHAGPIDIFSLPPLITVRQAVALGVGSDRTVRRMCERKIFIAKKVGSDWRIARDSVLEYFDLRRAEESYRQRHAQLRPR